MAAGSDVLCASATAQRVVADVNNRINTSKAYTFPIPDFAKARTDQKQRLLPQIIAHRGFRAKYPENTLLAFQEAIKAGATALETDLHLTKDDVVVISHGADLQGFGNKKQKILDCTWDEIKDLRTSIPPHLPMLRLQDLLDYLLQPETKDIWLLLDIKSDNEAEPIMRLAGSTVAGVCAPSDQPWNKRILLGLWAAKHLPLAAKFFPGFPAVHTGFHLSHARRILTDPHIGSLLLVQTLLSPGGSGFIRKCQAKPGPVMAWTVNSRDKAEWCARRGLDGIVTDDPDFMTKVWEQFDDTVREPLVPLSLTGYVDLVIIFILVNGLFWYFKRILKLGDDIVDERPKNNLKKQ